MLLEADAPLEQKDAQGKTALLHAVIMNDTEIVQLLLQVRKFIPIFLWIFSKLAKITRYLQVETSFCLFSFF